MRKMTYVLIGWSLLVFGWLVMGVASSLDGTAERCEHAVYLSQRNCEAAGHAGTALGVGAILAVGFCGFVVLSLVWFMTRPIAPRRAP